MANVIEVTRERTVARIWLDRPEQHNALTMETVADLTAAFHAAGHDDAVRVIVLAGRGPSFCAGVDIGWMKASANTSFEENYAEAKKIAAMFAVLADLPKPVVAQVHGNVFGGGVGLTAACDIAVVSDDAVFSLSEVRLGILPAIISPYVIRRLGDRNARELMLTGERFGARRALEVGLVNHIVTPAELEAKVEERVLALLAGGPQAQRRIKMLLELYADSTWEEYRAGLPRTLAQVRSGDEAKDGLSAFFEKRKPRWLA
jgi:methylglutaconyl-CoA hydratase